MKTQASKTQTIINASALVGGGCCVSSLLSGLESLKPADTKTQLYWAIFFFSDIKKLIILWQETTLYIYK